MEVGGGRKDHSVIGRIARRTAVVDHRGAVADRNERNAQRRVLHIAVVGQDVHTDGGIFVGCDRVGSRQRRVVDRANGDVGRRHCRFRFAVGHPVREGVRVREVGIRHVTELAAGIKCERSVGWPGHQHRRQHVLVRVAVVGEKTCGREGQQFLVLVNRVAVVGDHGQCVGRLHVEPHGHGVGVGLAVVGLVTEAIPADVPRLRRVGERAVGGEAHHAVRRISDEHCGERILLRVVVVGQHAPGDVHRKRCLRARAVAFGKGDRPIVDGPHRNRHYRRVGTARPVIVDLVRKTIDPKIVRSRNVEKPPVVFESHCAVGRAGDDRKARRVVVRVGIVGLEAVGGGDDQERVFVGAVAIILGDRRLIRGPDRDAHCGYDARERDRTPSALVVSHRVREAIRTGVTGVRCVRDRAGGRVKDAQTPMTRRFLNNEGEHLVCLRVAVVYCQHDCRTRLRLDSRLLRVRGRGIVDRSHRDRHCGHRAHQGFRLPARALLADGERESVAPNEVRRRCVGHYTRAGIKTGQCPVGRFSVDGEPERLHNLRIAITACQRQDGRRVLNDRNVLRLGYRRVVDALHGECHRHCPAVVDPIAGVIAERIGSLEAGRRAVAE